MSAGLSLLRAEIKLNFPNIKVRTEVRYTGIKKNNSIILNMLLSKKCLPICFFLATFNCYSSCSQSSHILYYRDGIELDQNSFKSSHNSMHSKKEVLGYVSVDISTEGNYRLNSAEIEVRAFLDSHKSWLKHELRKDRRALRHELYHFKITELYARQLRESLINVKMNLDELVELFSDIRKDCLFQQNQYDIETDHSNNFENQFFWENKIDRKLKNLSKYSFENCGIISVSY